MSRYDPSASLRTGGKTFTAFTVQDGLSDNWVHAIFQDREGRLWFSNPGGVSQYDGRLFSSLSTQDGLGGSNVLPIFQDREGSLWFGTQNGVTRYRPSALSPPPAFIDAIVADRRYEELSQIAIPTSIGVIAFEFHGVSLKTRPEALIYRYRLRGYNEEWKTTHARRVEYQDLPRGTYTFEMQVVDLDLTYSDLATARFDIIPDLRVEAMMEALNRSGVSGEFIGASAALRRVQRQLSEVAGTDETVLILGETGTGKGLAARAVHALSKRHTGPFIQVNCGAIPEGLVESELFGHERGAFTGAVSRKLGKVEVAAEGTLFLDEIGDTPLEAQVKLLRLLEERTFERVGGNQTLKAEVRVVAATNRELKQMVSEGKFREDLYFRLQGFPVRVPPLRERREDIPLLASYFLERMAAHLNKPVARLTPEALELLKDYDWPGNVRELEYAVRRAVIVCRGSEVRASDITLEFGKSAGASAEEMEEIVTIEEHERRYIQKVIRRTGGAIKGPRGAAALLGLPESTLRSRMKKLGILRTQA